MKVTIEFHADGLLRVHAGADRYTATEAAFRMDGPVPMMDLAIPLGEMEPVNSRPGRTMDEPPEDDADQ